MPVRYYDKAGQPIDRDGWSERFEDERYKRIGSTMVDGRWHVSTIWLGLDHNPFPGAPHIFETCVFDHHDIQEVDIWKHHDAVANSWVVDRYSTLDAARKGHKQVVRHIRKGGHPEDLH